MPRLLQLLNTNSPYDVHRASEHLAARLTDTYALARRTIGRGGHYRSAISAIRDLRRERFDLVHTWSISALLAAALSPASKIVFTPPLPCADNAIRMLRAILSQRDLHVVAPSATLDRALIQAGVPADRCHLIRPGVDFSTVRRRNDSALRAGLGLAPDEIVLLAIGESSPAAAHHLAVWATSILRVINPRFRLLLWGRGSALGRATHLAQRLEGGSPDSVVIRHAGAGSNMTFDSLLSIADLGLVTATDAVPALPIATAMAAGLPLVATATYATSELLEDRHTALMVAKPTPRLIARRVLDLQEDPRLQWSLADRARTEAYEHFSLSRYIDQHRSFYSQLLRGEPIHLPQPAPSVASRFHGRA